MSDENNEMSEDKIQMHLKDLTPESIVTYIDSLLQKQSLLGKKTIAFLKEEQRRAYMILKDKAIKLKNTDEAFKYYKKLGYADNVAFAFIGLLYGDQNEDLLAAECYEKAKLYKKAGYFYEKAGRYDRAIVLYFNTEGRNGPNYLRLKSQKKTPNKTLDKIKGLLRFKK